MNDDASEASRIARPLISSGRPRRPMGSPRRKLLRTTGFRLHTILQALVLHLGADDGVHARTPSGAHSELSSRVICATAPIAML